MATRTCCLASCSCCVHVCFGVCVCVLCLCVCCVCVCLCGVLCVVCCVCVCVCVCEWACRCLAVSLQDILKVGSYLHSCLAGFTIDKFRYASHIPYLLVHADDPEVCAVCLAQYDLALDGQSHRVSNHFCSTTADGSLRPLMDSCIATGAACAKLKHEVMLLNCGRLAEEHIEGPHRCVKREMSRASPARLPWMSASLTLKTNLALYEEFCSCAANKEIFVCLWRQHRSILSSVMKDNNTIEDVCRAHLGICFDTIATMEVSCVCVRAHMGIRLSE